MASERPRPFSRFGELRAAVRRRREESGYLRWSRRVAVSFIGFTVLLIGVIMVVTPGPAILVIPLGLAILATEFVWARRWLRNVKAKVAGLGKAAGI